MTTAPLFETNQDWRYLLANVITKPKELLELLDLDMSLLDEVTQVAQRFPLRVPRGFVARMNKGDINDPLLRQVLPIGIEFEITPGYVKDPLLEIDKNPLPGLLHKFYGRVLLILTGACAINCRYCFRQHFPYTSNNPGRKGWQDVISYIKKDNTITEVILSGGDPLIATDHMLSDLARQLQEIPHLKRLRIHSRMPIILPERISSELIAWIKDSRLKITFVMHCNHAQEINSDVKKAMVKLSLARVTLLNQAVLLKGVNDTVDTLTALSEALFECGILPYYLFLLDKVQGAAHFDIPMTQAQQLHQDMANRLPGYLVPKLAKEQAGEPAKVLMNYVAAEI